MARIDRLLQQLLYEKQAGLREGSVLSIASIECVEDEDEDVWNHISRELEDIGITSEAICENRSYIIGWIANALKSGAFVEEEADTSSREFSDEDDIQIMEGSEDRARFSQSKVPTVPDACHEISDEEGSLRAQNGEDQAGSEGRGLSSRPPSHEYPEGNGGSTVQNGATKYEYESSSIQGNYLFLLTPWNSELLLAIRRLVERQIYVAHGNIY